MTINTFLIEASMYGIAVIVEQRIVRNKFGYRGFGCQINSGSIWIFECFKCISKENQLVRHSQNFFNFQKYWHIGARIVIDNNNIKNFKPYSQCFCSLAFIYNVFNQVKIFCKNFHIFFWENNLTGNQFSRTKFSRQRIIWRRPVHILLQLVSVDHSLANIFKIAHLMCETFKKLVLSFIF